MMLVANVDGSKDGFSLDDKHKKVLGQFVKSYPIESLGNEYNNSVHGALLSVLGKAEIFSKCSEVIKADQIAKNRETFLPINSKVAPKESSQAR